MATTLKAILDDMATGIEAVTAGSGDLRQYGWTRRLDSRETRLEPGQYRLLLSEADRDAEFGVDATETLSTQIVAEFCRAQQIEDDASFFAELSALASAIESATYPAGTIAVIVRTRTVARQFSDPTWIVGTLAVNLKWEQAY
jgi:hypothetical protein